MEGITSEFLRAKLTLENNGVYSKEEVLQYVKENQPELLVTVGAGDIDTLIQPLKNILTNV